MIIDQTPMTLKGFKKLKKKLEYLKLVKRQEIVLAISEARKLGDLKENAEYHSAREEQGFCEKKIFEIENKLSNARVIDIKKIPYKGIVVFGSTITLFQVKTNIILKYTIVGDDEADLKKKTVSIHSPMARGLISKKIGDIAIIKTPSGILKYVIKNIEYI